MYLHVVDTTGIQPYIFGSNRLRENIGASYLVAQATGPWALACVPGDNNVRDAATNDLTDERIEDGRLDAEVLYAGGGNVVTLFRDATSAETFERALSKKVLEAAPGVQLVAAGRDFVWGGPETLAAAVRALHRRLFDVKRASAPSAPLLGLGVTVACGSTGRPAVGTTRPVAGDVGSTYPASAEILEKRDAYGDANDRLTGTLGLPDAERFAYPREFDDLGRTEGETSYLAVVHADGNSMGRRVTDIGKRYGADDAPGGDHYELNRGYIESLRAFSDAVEEAAVAAQKQMLDALCEQIDLDEGTLPHTNDSGRELNRITLDRAPGGRWHLPFRPLVFGGDDLTFVCDGRLGLALAIDYVQRFEDQTQRVFEERGRLGEWGGSVTACAGVAVVKAHYPFARAYALAEKLTSSAKTFRRQIRAHRNAPDDWDGACLDWHFAQGELAGALDVIRERTYEVPAGTLTLRPVVLGEHPLSSSEAARTWPVVEEGIAAFQRSDEEGWAGRRNKVKRLRDALRGGEAQVRDFTGAHGDLPALPIANADPALTERGWYSGRCAYFDAIELADLHMSLT